MQAMMVLIVSLMVALAGSRSAAHEPGRLSGAPWRKARHGDVSDCLPDGAAAAVRAGGSAAPFLLVSRSAQGVHRGDAGRSRLRHGLLGHRHESLVPDLVAAEPGRTPAGVGGGREGTSGAEHNTPGARLHHGRRGLLPGWDTRDHRTRALAYEQAMEQVYRRYPQDREAAAFYALALQATADPKDKSYAQQRKSSAIAEQIFAAVPDHPGAAHYLIHAYDYPTLAARGLDAARRYAQFAPSVPHALHMPSHIYVLLGMWPETIQGNLAAAAAEQQRGNPDDHLHALDYLVYAYLQQAQDREAQRVLNEGRGIVAELATRHYDSGRPTAHFAIAAMEARWAMERERWAEAAALAPRPNKYPHTEAMIFFARAIGAARTGNGPQARADVAQLARLREALLQAQNSYWAEQVDIQQRASAAWALHAEGKGDEALAMMRAAAELEESTEKHNITPGPIALARELLGDMLLELRQPAQALRE